MRRDIKETMNGRHQQIIDSATDILKSRLDPGRIILFGSRAKKNNCRHCDFDFAVDVSRPSFSQEREINEEIAQVSGLYKVDIVYLDSVEKGFKELILKTGRVIYERRK